MYGHESLIEFRKAGVIPDGVWIDAGPVGALDPAQDWAKWVETQTHARIQIEPHDRVPRLDLRCVRGMQCRIDGEDTARVREVRDACIAAGAKRVIAAVLRRIGYGEWQSFQMTECTDTEGVIVFPLEMAHG